MEQNGAEWRREGAEWSRVEQRGCREHDGAEWSRLEQNGAEWNKWRAKNGDPGRTRLVGWLRMDQEGAEWNHQYSAAVTHSSQFYSHAPLRSLGASKRPLLCSPPPPPLSRSRGPLGSCCVERGLSNLLPSLLFWSLLSRNWSIDAFPRSCDMIVVVSPCSIDFLR
jgi:hypothetical protein